MGVNVKGREWLLITGWSMLLLWPAVLQPNQPIVLRGSQFSDLLVSHWPNAEFLRHSLSSYHQFPLWNPSILGGAPFAADPLAGVWYLPNWLAVVLPLPFAFNLLLMLHLAWGGWGMFRWAQADGFGWWPSLIGGLAYAGMPKVLAHIGAGHISLAFAVAWMPWLLHSVDRAAASARWVGPASVTAIIWAATFLADVRWGVYAGMAMAAWWLISGRWQWRSLLGLAVSAALFLALTAVLWAPMLELVQHTSRADLSLADTMLFALEPWHLLGFLVANVGGSHEAVLDPGVVVLTLAVVAVLSRKQRSNTWKMLVLGGLALWWALGPNAGFYAVFSRLPGLAFLRVPSRTLFLVGLAVCWLAVRGASELEAGYRPGGRLWNLSTAAVIAAAWILAIGVSIITRMAQPYLFAAAIGLSAAGWLLRTRTGLPWVALFVAAELWFLAFSFSDSRAVARSEVAGWLAAQPGRWRVYSPSFSLPPLDAAQASLEQADGVNPLQLAGLVAFMDSATGVQRNAYSVTVPPFASDVATANADAVPDARLLGLLNVRYVVSEFDIGAPGLELQAVIDGTRVYENAHDAGRVRGGDLMAWTPNRIEVAADGPGVVTLSEIWFPGWVASIDGAPAEVQRDDVFRSVMVGPGDHTITFEYRPISLLAGGLVSLLGILALGAIWWLKL